MTTYDVVLTESIKIQDSIVATVSSQGATTAYALLGVLSLGLVGALVVARWWDNKRIALQK